MKESVYQHRLIRRLEKEFPGCFIIPNDPDLTQGIPDLLILFNDRWAMLEVKTSADAPNQPNQPYYVALFDTMSFASFIYPEIEDEVFRELQRSFCDIRTTRVS
jgi:hypothetical protein